jgi:hypothetical protein
MSSGKADAVLWRGGKAAVGWALVLALVGLTLRTVAARGRPRSRSALAAYATEAVLPVYLLHQTVAVVLGWWVLSWPVAAGVQWLSLTLLTVTVTLALDEVLRRPAVTRRLLGLRSLALAQRRPCRISARSHRALHIAAHPLVRAA